MFLDQTQIYRERPIDPGDTQIAHYLIGTWAKVCQAMSPEFESYLPVVMPFLLATASAKARLSDFIVRVM